MVATIRSSRSRPRTSAQAHCAECHPSEYQATLTSRHSTTFARASDSRSFPLPDHPIPDSGDSAVRHRYERRDDGIHVETTVGGQVFRAVAQYAFGSPDHFVTLTGPDDQGRSHMLRMSHYDSPKGAGLDLSTGLASHPARPDGFLGERMDSGDGERRCLTCHTTNFRAIEDRVGPESADPAIGCERLSWAGRKSCPGGRGGVPGPRDPLTPRRTSAETVNRVCGECHGLTKPRGAIGEPDDPAWFRFQGARLHESRCFERSGGRLHCMTCHDPHRTVETAAAPYEAKCLNCHGPGKTTCPVNSTQGCIGCHMPRTWRQPTRSFQSDHKIRITRPGVPVSDRVVNDEKGRRG